MGGAICDMVEERKVRVVMCKGKCKRRRRVVMNYGYDRISFTCPKCKTFHCTD